MNAIVFFLVTSGTFGSVGKDESIEISSAAQLAELVGKQEFAMAIEFYKARLAKSEEPFVHLLYYRALKGTKRELNQETLSIIQELATKSKCLEARYHYEIGCIFQRRGESDVGLDRFPKAIKCDPSFAPAFYGLARSTGDPKIVLDACARGLAITHPDSELYVLFLERIRQIQGRMK